MGAAAPRQLPLVAVLAVLAVLLAVLLGTGVPGDCSRQGCLGVDMPGIAKCYAPSCWCVSLAIGMCGRVDLLQLHT